MARAVVAAAANDGASPEKTDAGDDLGRDPRRVELQAAAPKSRPRERLEAVGRDQGEERRPEAEQDVRPETGGLVADLALEADGAAQHNRQDEAQGYLPVRDRQPGQADPSRSEAPTAPGTPRSSLSPWSPA